MFPMAIGTDWGIGLSPGGQLTMYSFPVVLFNGFMAFTASIWDRKMIYGGPGISRSKYLVCRTIAGMTVVAGGSVIYPTRCGFAVNTGLVCLNWFLR